MTTSRQLVQRIALLCVTVAICACGAAPPQSESAAAPIVRLAFPSEMDIGDIPVLLAAEQLQEEGFAIVPTFYAQSELAAAAVAAGEAEVGLGSNTVWLSAIQAGAPVRGIAGQVANDWSIVSREEISTCTDLDGRRVGIHSEGGVSTAMVRAYVDRTCPGTEPDYVIVPGSSNRMAALLAGELDASPLEFVDAVRLEAQGPGQFRRLSSLAQDLPELQTTGVWINTTFAAEHPDLAGKFVRALLTTNERIQQDPAWFTGEVQQRLAFDEEDAALLPGIVAALVEVEAFPLDGGITPENTAYSIDFFTSSGRLEPGLTVDSAFDFSFLQRALDELGRQ